MIKIIAKDEIISRGGFCCADLACDYRKFISAVCLLNKGSDDDVMQWMQLLLRHFEEKMRYFVIQSELEGFLDFLLSNFDLII